MGDRGNVYAAGGHVGGHEQTHLALAQAVQHVFALVLRKVGGKLVGVVAEALEHGGDVVHVGLGVAEDDGRGGILGFHEAHESAVLVHASAFHEEMLNGGHVHVPLREAEHLGLAQEFSGEVQDVLGIGGGKERGKHGMRGQIALNLLHVGVEADGEHSVRLVEDKDAQGVEGKSAAQKMVEHAAGRAHDDLHALAQGLELTAVAHAAVKGGHGKARAFKKKMRLVLHLAGELARGGKNEGLRLFFRRIEQRKKRQQIRGLAAARAGLHHEVASGHEVGKRVRLHGHEARPACARAGLLHDLGQLFQRAGRQRMFRSRDLKLLVVRYGIRHWRILIRE